MKTKNLWQKSAWIVAPALLLASAGMIHAVAATDADSDTTPVNLLNGAILSTGTPADAGWVASTNVTWLSARNAMDDNGEYFRPGQTMSNGSVGAVFYPKSTHVVFGYPVDVKPGKMYKLNGILWKRNGGDATTTYTFGISKDVKDMADAHTADIAVQGNSKYVNLDINLAANPDYDTESPTYFTWEVSALSDPSQWQRGGLFENISLTEIGNAASVVFVSGEDASAVPAQYFLEGSNYTVKVPAAPEKVGYDFAGWFADEALTTAFDFSKPVTATTYAYAGWTRSVVDPTVNLAQGWDGHGVGNNSDKPNDFGWTTTGASVVWSTVQNSGVYDNKCYYRDNLNPDGKTVRALNHDKTDEVFAFPLKAMLAGNVYTVTLCSSNMNHDISTTFGVNTKADGTGTSYGSTTVTARKWSAYTNVKFHVVPRQDGKYYFTWKTSAALDRNFIWNLSVKAADDMAIATFLNADGSVYDYTAYELGSPAPKPAGEPTDGDNTFIGWYADEAHTRAFDFNAPREENVTVYPYFFDGTVATTPTERTITETTTLNAVANERISVKGDASLYIAKSTPLLGNSSIDLAGDGNWLYVEHMQPSKFIEAYPKAVTVGGRNLDIYGADRIALYRNGFVVIPNGQLTVPVELYNGENLTGDMMECYQDVFYRSAELGDKFDNKIRSFKVRKGWQLCLANNPDGIGFSKIFIAADGDLVVNTMPEALEFASFARVSRFDWTGKKGYANPGGLDASVAWFYDWNVGGDSHQLDREYVVIRQNLGWPSWNDIYNKENINTVLGQNEPDHTDQSNATVTDVMAQWHEMFKSGRRLGSPTPDSLNKWWLDNFIAMADSLNYRVDFVVAHMYWNSTSGASLKNSIQEQSRRTGWRPVWITEMNNGANWTTEWWPDASGPRRDADFNLILDADGNEQTTSRPHSEANSAKQVAWLRDVLPALDDCPYLERHAFYNWVQDARAVELGGKLTPAGRVFDEHNSAVAYRSANAYDHKWHIAPPFAQASLSDDFSDAVISWYDHNGETGTNYIVEKRNDEGAWQQAAVLVPGEDYEYGATINYVDPLDCTSRVDYRVKATSYKGGESIYSRFATIVRDVPGTPVLNAEVLSSTIVRLSWQAVSGVRAYRIERRTTYDSNAWTVVVPQTTDLTYDDKNLEPKTTYVYRLVALSSAATDPISNEVTVKTPVPSRPLMATGIFVSAGDSRIAISWDFAYDAMWKVERSDSQSGEYTTVADGLTATTFADKDVVNGNAYYYRVIAYNDMGEADATAPVEAVPVAGRYVYYPFDEAEGTVAHDHHGGFHGTLYNNAEWTADRNGEAGKALALSRSKQAHVQLADGLMDGMEDFTIATWVKFTGTYARLVDFGQNTGNFLIIAPSADKIRYKLTCGAGTCDVTVPAALPANEWHHIVLTQEGNDLTFYVNGEKIASAVNESGVTPGKMGHSTSNYLGRSHWASDAYADHHYDDLYVLDRALSASDVQTLYATGVLTASSAAGVYDVADADEVTATVEGGDIIVLAGFTCDVDIHSIDGRLVARVHAFPGKTYVKGLASGVYVACGKKLLIK